MGKSHSRIDPCAQFAGSQALLNLPVADNATSPLQPRDHFHDCRGYVEQQAHHPDKSTQDAHRKGNGKEEPGDGKDKRNASRGRRRRGLLRQGRLVDVTDGSDARDGGAGARGSTGGTTLGLSALGGVGAMGGLDTPVMLDSAPATLAPGAALWLGALCLVAVLLGIYVHMGRRRAAKALEVTEEEKETLCA